MNGGQFTRTEEQVKLYSLHHYAFDTCPCPSPHGRHYDCIADCCKYELSQTAKGLVKGEK